MGRVRSKTNEFFEKSANIGLKLRQGQVEMADEICRAFETHKPLAIEAEVGIGKSYAYLIPAVYEFLRVQKQIVIATSTIALQEQLNKDAHNVLKMLGVNIDIVVAKGMKNYICKRRLKGLLSHSHNDPIIEKLWAIVEKGTQDIADIRMKIPQKLLERLVISNFGNDKCRTCNCSLSCEYSMLRNQISKGKNIVICNQNMLVSHLASGSSIFDRNCGTYIIDEAHNLESKFRDAFSASYSKNNLIKILNGYERMVSENHSKLAKRLIGGMCDTLQKLYKEFNRQIYQQTDGLDEGVSSFYFHRTKETLIYANELYRKAERFEQFTDITLNEISSFALSIIEPESDDIMWLENGENIRLCICKKDISKDIGKLLFTDKNVILTSATISCSQTGTPMEKYEFFLDSIHFPTNAMVSEPKRSPFDYKSNAILYCSSILPMPKHDKKEEYREASIEEILKLLEITQGKALILFTARSDMDYVYKKLSNMHLPYKIMIQGSRSSQAHLLKDFRSNVDSVILGTGVYWEGINVEGRSLSQVIIYKLPFPYPDPIVNCKMSEAEDPLMEVVVPEMIIKLRQGVGRLMRSENDKGIISILDPRLSSKSEAVYKDDVLAALPFCKKTENIRVIEEFWRKIAGGEI